MAHEYTKVFSNPYPSGWQNLPSTSTPIIAQALQQHTNAIIAIENFLKNYSIPSKLSELQNDGVIPTKVSELQNDRGFITQSNVPTKLSQLQNDTKYIVKEQIPDKLSDYINDLGFITSSVNSLLNYYLKSELYSKLEIDQLLSHLNGLKIEVVNELPTENISENTIYFVPKVLDDSTDAQINELNFSNFEANDDPLTSFSIGDSVSSDEVVEEDPFNA